MSWLSGELAKHVDLIWTVRWGLRYVSAIFFLHPRFEGLDSLVTNPHNVSVRLVQQLKFFKEPTILESSKRDIQAGKPGEKGSRITFQRMEKATINEHAGEQSDKG